VYQHSLKTLKLAEFVIGMDDICGVSGASKECGAFWVGSNAGCYHELLQNHYQWQSLSCHWQGTSSLCFLTS
jgi:hypothetical protein